MTEIVPSSEKQRVLYFDFLRGIAVIMVVAIHVFGQCFTKENIPIYAVLLRQVMNCAVPVFCASSAYFLITRNLEGQNYQKFLARQIPRVYIPLLFCSLPYLCIDLRSGTEIWNCLLKYFFCGYSVYYFVALIIQFYVLLPLFQKLSLFRNIFLGLVVSLLWVTVYIYIVKPVVELPLVLYGGPIFCFFVHFAAGAALRKKQIESKKLFAMFLILAWLFLCLSVIESYLRMKASGTLEGTGLKPSAVLFSACVVILLYGFSFERNFPENSFTKFIGLAGRFSFGIYLTHLFILAVLNKGAGILFKDAEIVAGGGTIVWLILTIIVFFADFGTLLLLRKVSPKLSRLFLGV